ncbi:PD-(D/E)XK nuclease family protein [Wenyingzhuangia sp. 1_MG-2023]|nr:PD-(D/E)XK nuclease family protein [Wenyingzhuangia sp. 1_MG-2023]
METFLQETAQAIINRNTDFKNIICVLPSERAGIYLKEALKNKSIGKAIFLPKIISIEKFIKEISEIESMDQVSLVFELFHVYKKHCKKNQLDTFERFIGWATIAIQDFNEIDRHLVKADEIFSYLTDIQKIKDWSPEKDETTPTIKNYMSFVEDLHVYYQELNKVLQQKKSGYQGLIYREAYHKCEEYLNNHDDEIFYFIGFNALNKAEENIFNLFLDKEHNHIYWDIDSYYFDGKHEAGTFVRSFFNEWDCLKNEDRKNWIHSNFKQKKNIRVLGSSLNVTGIKAVSSFLGKDLDPKETAMVLAEESLLPVVLNSIPEEVKKVNITMGYSLSNIPLSGLFQSLFELHLNKQKLGKNAFYYKDVLSFLRHPYLNKVTENKLNSIIQNIVKNNLVFLSEEMMSTFFKDSKVEISLSNLFLLKDDVSTFLQKIIEFLDFLNKKLEGIELLYVEGYRKVFQEIINLNNQYSYIDTFKVLHKVFKKLIPLETVDFRGEALEGMQLMGMLETRCLDFKNVILTSVNEGVLPSGKSERSFISFEVKKHFKMPTYLAKDAIFSYHFYRLIQRAENIYLLYNTQTDDFGGGEMSRFLTQLMLDKEDEITYQNVVSNTNENDHRTKEIEKTPKVMEALFTYFKKGASPSRITEYMNDPWEFYQKMVLKIRETDKVEEEVAHNTLGTIVHDSLEFLYQPYLNKILIPNDILDMKTNATKMVSEKFREHFKEGDITTGKNKLIFEVAKQFVLNFLNNELNEIHAGKEIIVKELETDCNVQFTTPNGHQIALRGKIDRVDEVNGVRRIVDYKTGKVEAKDLKLSDISLATSDYKYHKIVQVMTYMLLYSTTQNLEVDKMELQAGIYSFKNLKAGFLAMNFSETYKKEHSITKAHIESFKMSLLTMIDEILDNKLTFVENIDRKFKKEA